MEDKEIQAIASVNSALKDLAEDERYRVIQWLANKYVQNMPPMKVAAPAQQDTQVLLPDGDGMDESAPSSSDSQPYETFAEFLDASHAEVEADQLLVAAYWVQVVGNKASWKSFEANKLLKDTGNQINRVSNPLRDLEKRDPKPIVQLRQSTGEKKRGAKEMKLTSEGIKNVKEMLARNNS